RIGERLRVRLLRVAGGHRRQDRRLRRRRAAPPAVRRRVSLARGERGTRPVAPAPAAPGGMPSAAAPAPRRPRLVLVGPVLLRVIRPRTIRVRGEGRPRRRRGGRRLGRGRRRRLGRLPIGTRLRWRRRVLARREPWLRPPSRWLRGRPPLRILP